MKFKNKTILITGASSGIGALLAKECARLGANLIIGARSEIKLNDVKNDIMENGGKCVAIKTDITRPADCKQLVTMGVKIFGRIDILVLNAGISMWAPFTDIDDVQFFKDLMDTNYHGALNTIHPALPFLKESHGLIVSISTGQAIMGFPNHTGYAASKHALKGLTDSLECEMGDSVQFMDIILGWIRGTNLRNNAFGPDGTQIRDNKKSHSKESISVEECVEGIINGIRKKKRTVYLPWKLSLIPFVKLFFPWYLNRKMRQLTYAQE